MTKFSTLQQTVHLRSRAKFHPDQFILLPLGLVAKKKQIVLYFQLGAIDTKLNAGTQLQLKMSPAAFSTFVTQTFIYPTISKPLTSSNALMAKAEALSQMHSKSDGQKHRPSRVLCSHAPLHRWRWNLAGRSRSTPLRQIPPPPLIDATCHQCGTKNLKLAPDDLLTDNSTGGALPAPYRPRNRRILSTICANFHGVKVVDRPPSPVTPPSSFCCRRRILSPVLRCNHWKKSACLNAVLFLHSLQRSTNSKLQQFNLQLF